MHWRGRTIVDISRAFLDTNGAHQEAAVTVEIPAKEGNLFERKEIGDVKEQWLKLLSSLNVCSQKGLVEMFDASIGAGSTYMPYGGRYQLTETHGHDCQAPCIKGQM